MIEKITALESPIDVMLLMHEAFRAHSTRVEEMAAGLEGGGSLEAFTDAFGFWGKALLFHATAEDAYMTSPLPDSQPARDNETEHAEIARQATELVAFIEKGDSAGLGEAVRSALAATEAEQHKELAQKVSEIEGMLKQELGSSRVTARTRRHLYRQVMELRVTEYDHFENEEAFVVPLVRDRISNGDQVEMCRHLLIDDSAEEPRWIIDWVASEIDPGERELLDGLAGRFTEVPVKGG